MIRLPCALLLAVILSWTDSTASGQDAPVRRVDFRVQLDVARQELNPGFCWFHPRAAAIPEAGRNGQPAVVMTLQKHLRVSDYYSGLWMMRSEDLGKTWSGPTEIPELAWQPQPNDMVLAVADVTPGYHAPSGKLLAIGCTVRYSPRGEQLADTKRFSQTAYAVYSPKTERWSTWQILDMPPDDKFNMARNACAQWMVESDGTLLLPMYFAPAENVPCSVTVVRCQFDGQKLSYLAHGDELTLNVVRGLCEPSIVKFQERYWLTIRNDVKGYVTSGRDGLHYEPIQPWTFDDGSELGSYNTQQHWLTHGDGLFLCYTRRGANNDHIERNRAPLFVAQVDPRKPCVLRSTEQLVLPERGVMLGNFGAASITAEQSWVTDAELMLSDQPHPRGANGSVWVGRVLWTPAATEPR